MLRMVRTIEQRKSLLSGTTIARGMELRERASGYLFDNPHWMSSQPSNRILETQGCVPGANLG